jgi:hypothetical protein
VVAENTALHSWAVNEWVACSHPDRGATLLFRLVEVGLLNREQAAPRAPWEIRRSDLDAEPVRSIIEQLRRTGKLVLRGGRTEGQPELFVENQSDDNARHYE